MKKALTILSLAALMALPAALSAQRASNQSSFKKASGDNYRAKQYINSNEINANLFETQQGYTQNNRGGVQTFIKDNEMILEVRSLMNVKADRFLAVFNLTQIGETAKQTNDLINGRIDGFVTALSFLGVKKEEVYTDMIYLIPTFEFEVEKKLFSKTYNEVPTGFEMQKNIHITFSDINTVEKLVTLAANNEIYDFVKLDFFIEETDKKYDTLRTRTIDFLNKQISSIEKLDFDLKGKYHVAREASKAIYPQSQYNDFDAYVSQSIEAVQKKSVSKIRKPKTVAYDQIPYNEFSLVINPNILEPVVQLVYALQVKYTLDKPIPTPTTEKNNYMLVTPTGEIIKLNIQK